ncbi:ribonuclease P 40kDa subunit-domain-containing protein [Xylogone sp. PMI_703]|nr:ribonuclease P 40kDa subunit-domain-containing protein [Xylogone sp. PMI_703]
MGHLDPKQPPVKRNPYAAVLNQRFVHQVQFILLKEIYEVIQTDLVKDEINPTYSRVILPLRSLVEGEFFNEYIKKGNILMLSEGRVGIDNVYSLKDGILTLHLDKESYERAGIVGKPEGTKGGRGSKPRWVVNINLRLPSMLHGKKGFDRIVYAFKNVLTEPVTWLFTDLNSTCKVSTQSWMKLL